MLLISLVCILLLYRAVVRWLRKPAPFKPGTAFEVNDDYEITPEVELLQGAGYEVISGKLKVPLAFEVDQEIMHSRLFIDYVARLDGEYYLVKTARSRWKFEWTGSGVRDALLPYLLIYPNCAGVLYIDTDQREIKQIHFIPEEDE
ncbi:hypothetical protein DCC85_13210 [Paenibacillus sp. CAA11]|nr:hypothetical protein DCC85_13210 [Paenibacillus sp. CAA11]